MTRPDMESHFKTIQSFKIDYGTSIITQYESERTGMRIVAIDQEGPKVSGYFALATEIHDDSGAPHTLEHLVFMGSRSYKYKGFLDKLATRSYSNTNAWTATDHTAYTLDTAGWEGFAQLLPVYLEHVLFPTLTDSACYTEVHHIDGTGHDAGVVYSEMQGVQNGQNELMDLEARRLLYPEGVGFRYETGGMMEKLRVLTADRIRAFHHEMYHPKNLCLVLVGEIDHKDLLGILDEFETGILDDIPKPDASWKRPWIDSPQPPPLESTVVKTVNFPEEDESFGEIMVGWLGPDQSDSLKMAALSVLLIYLCGSSVSTLENTLVEKEQVASAVYYSLDSRPDTLIWLALSSVATKSLASVEKRLLELLKETAAKPVDLDYMAECCRRSKRQAKSQVEESPYFFPQGMISDFLYGKLDGSTLRSFETLDEYDKLEKWTDSQWRGFLRKWMSDAHHVSILGTPSAAMSKNLKDAEQKRLTEQKQKLGEEGLKRLAEKLAKAKAENDKEIPRSLLEKFKIPGTESIHFINTFTARSGLARHETPLTNKAQQLVDQDSSNIPLFLHFEHIPSNFVQVTLVLSTESIPIERRPLLALYIMGFFDTPILRDGKLVDFEKVVMELERETVSYSMQRGFIIVNPETLCIQIQVEPEKYTLAIHWLRTMLWDSVFDVTRLKTNVAKMLSDIPEQKRDGNSMLQAVDTMIHYAPKSIARACNTLVKSLYLKRISRLLKEEPNTVVSQLEDLRNSICQFQNFRVLVVADVEKLKHPVSAWASFINNLDTSQPLNPVDSRKERLSEAGRDPGNHAYIVPMPTIDSSYSSHKAKGPESLTHPQLPALMVAQAFLDAVEGPMWAEIRGTGLAYGTGFTRDPDVGLIAFQIYRSPDAYKAFKRAKQVVEDFISGATPFDPPALEGAISSIVVQYADKEPTMSQAASTSFTNQVIKGVPADYNAQMLKTVRKVSEEEIKRVMKEVLLPVFLPESSNTIVTCAPLLVESIKKGFQNEGFKAEEKPLAFFQDDYGLQPKDGEDEVDDEEEDEFDDESEESEGKTRDEL